MPTLKDPRKVAAGKAGMRARWGPPRVINLHDLPPEQRDFIAELVDVARRNVARTPSAPLEAGHE